MALSVVRYGRYRTAAEADFGLIADNQLRACVFDTGSQNIWVTKLGQWGGRANSNTTTLTMGLYTLTSGGNPSSLLVKTGAVSVTTSKTSAGGGAAITGSTTAYGKIASGSRYAIAILCEGTSPSFNHSMRQAAAITATNEDFYGRTGLTDVPSSFGTNYTRSTEGHLTAWAEGYLNEAPLAPASLAPSGNITTTTPTMTGTFRDLNGAYGTANGGVDTGDKMTRFRIQVRTSGSATVDKWDFEATPTSTEVTNNASSRTYAGTTLTRGTTYEWRTQVADDFSAWGAWSAWTTFTPQALGTVTTDGAPTGKIENDTPDFTGKWTHQDAKSTDRVQIRLYNSAGALIATSSEITKTVTSSAAPGTSFTITWAESGFATLAWGTAYSYEIRGRDTDNLWSNWSTPRRTFTTNASPSVPSALAPANSAIYTAYPLLVCTATDSDDTTATGFEVSARIKDSGGTVLFTRTMTYNSGAGRWEYQTDGTDLASFATYKWDASAYDGTLYSGSTTSSGSRTWSSEATFIYAQGPTVTMVTPLDEGTVTSSALTVDWTTTNQARYKVQLFANGTTTELYTSGWVVSATTQHDIPSGTIRNGVSYDLLVTVEDTTPLEGTSGLIDFTASFTPPAALTGVTGQAIRIADNPWPSAVRFTWDESTEPNFNRYVITRTATTGPDAGTITLAEVTSSTTTAYTDYLPASGVEYVYGIVQVIQSGLDELTSDAVEVFADITLGGIVLTSVTDGEVQAAVRFTAERDEERTLDEVTFMPLSGGAPATIRSKVRYRTLSFDAKLIGDDYSTAAQKKSDLEALDRADAIVMYRDNHGRKFACKIVDLTFTDQLPDWWTARLSLREERFTEGVD